MLISCFFFFFNDTATTEIYTLSLHDALPIYCPTLLRRQGRYTRDPSFHQSRPNDLAERSSTRARGRPFCEIDRKSTRLNSSHSQISYAVFCLKKKKKKKT